MKTKTNKLRFSLSTVFLGLLVLSLSLTTVTAAWAPYGSSTGTWAYSDDDHFGQTGFSHSNYEIIQWSQTVNNFSGYVLDLNTLITDVNETSILGGRMHVVAGVGFFVNNVSRAVIWIEHDQSQNIFGKTTHVIMGSRQQLFQAGGGFLSHINENQWASSHVVLNTTNTETTVQYLNLPNMGQYNPVVVWSDQIATNIDGAYLPQFYEKFATDLYDETVELRFVVACQGDGTFEWLKLGESILTGGTQPDAIPPTNTIGGEPFINQLARTITELGTTLFYLGSMLTGMLMALVPYLGIIFFSYLADALIASVQEGSLQPIGSFYKWIFGMLMQVYERIIDIAQAVAEALPF